MMGPIRGMPLAVGFALLLAIGTGQPDGPELQLYRALNAYRANSLACWDKVALAWRPWPAGAPRALTYHAGLAAAALDHARMMTAMDCPNAHQCPGEPDLLGRVQIQVTAFSWNRLAENISRGRATGWDVVLDGWGKSTTGHNETQLSCAARDVGVGYVAPVGLTYRHYWVAVFGYVETR